MEKVIISTIKTLVEKAQQAAPMNRVHLAALGIMMNAEGINYKNLGFLKLKEMFEDPDIQPFFELEKDDSTPPVYYIRKRECSSSLQQNSSTDVHSIKKNARLLRQNSPTIDGNEYSKIPSITQWAYFPDFPKAIQNLKELALKEKWYYKRQNPNYPYPILSNYLKYTFVRLTHEHKIMELEDYAAFNTGLVDSLYDPIFALFEKNKNVGKQQWIFKYFCVAGQDWAGKTLSKFFHPLPEKAKYFQSAEDYIYDGQEKPQMDWEHIILDHVERWPIEFLVANKPSDFIFKDTCEMDERVKDEYYQNLAKAIKKDEKTYRGIKMKIENALEIAIKRANWNYKTAIPMYYPKGDNTSLLLPLSLSDEKTIDVALVIQKMESGNYIGHTIYPLEWAYSNARLITRPDSDWLITELIHEDDNLADD